MVKLESLWSITSQDAGTLTAGSAQPKVAKVMVVRVSLCDFSLLRRMLRPVCCTSVFVCVAALAILDRLDLVDTPTLAWWISERQLPNGGLNGRPEKLEDVSHNRSFSKRVISTVIS